MNLENELGTNKMPKATLASFSGEDEICKYIRLEDPNIMLKAVYEKLGTFKMTERILSCLINVLLQHILRTLPRSVNPIGSMYSAEDDLDVKHLQNSLSSLSLKLLIFIVRSHNTSSILLNGILGEKEILRLIELTRSDISTERISISEFILEMLLYFPKCSDSVICGLSNELTSFLENERSHVGIENVLNMIGAVVKNHKFKNEDSASIFYYQNILKMTDTKFFGTSKEISCTFRTFNRLYPYLIPLTIKYFDKVFVKMSSRNKVMIISIFHKITEFLEDGAYLSIENSICRLLSTSFESHHYLLIEEAAAFLISKKNYSIVEKHTKTFVPKVFDAVYRLSKRLPSNQGLAKVLKNLYLILMMDYITFEECLRVYNIRRWRLKLQNTGNEKDF